MDNSLLSYVMAAACAAISHLYYQQWKCEGDRGKCEKALAVMEHRVDALEKESVALKQEAADLRAEKKVNMERITVLEHELKRISPEVLRRESDSAIFKKPHGS